MVRLLTPLVLAAAACSSASTRRASGADRKRSMDSPAIPFNIICAPIISHRCQERFIRYLASLSRAVHPLISGSSANQCLVRAHVLHAR